MTIYLSFYVSKEKRWVVDVELLELS